MALHNGLNSSDIHVIHALTYADAASRTGATGLLTTDIGKIAKQTDTSRFYILTNFSPVTWSEVTAPSNGGGGINYITNPNGEDSTAGWATYADAAASSPVDGTGGAPTLTLTRSTSSPLRGTACFLLTKDAANRQGNGASYDFTIDRADLAKVLEVTVDIESTTGFAASSGAVSSDSDIKWFMYDVTNSVLVPLSPGVITAGIGVQQTFRGTFQTASNSSSYRLIGHVATTNATAWTLKFDNVRVGPPSVSQGTTMTDWTAYTPAFVGFGTVTPGSIYSRRVGDTLQVQGFFTAGTPTAVVGSMTLGFNGASANVSTDTAKVAGTTIIGKASVSTSSTTVFDWAVLASSSSPTTVNFSTQSSTTNQTTGPVNGNSLTSTGQSVFFYFQVPIAGWSSNVQMSSETDTRVVAASYNGTSSVIAAQNTWNAIAFGTKQFDTHGAYNTSTGAYTVPVSGKYRITVSTAASITAAAANTDLLVGVGKNSNTSPYAQNQTTAFNTSANFYQCQVTTTVDAVAGDILYGLVEQSMSATTNIALNTGTSLSYFAIERISGPAAIAATESVGMRYTTSSQATTTTTAVAVFTVKDFDTHNAYNTSTGIYTVPVSGMYSITGVVLGSARVGASHDMTASIQANGSTIASTNIFINAASNPGTVQMPGQCSATTRLLAGQTITFSARTGYNDNLSGSATANMMSIVRVGN